MKTISRILTLLVLIKVALGSNNDTTILESIKSDEIISKSPELHKELLIEEPSLMSSTNKINKIQNGSFTEENTTKSSLYDVKTVKQVDIISAEVSTTAPQFANDAVVEYIVENTIQTKIEIESNFVENATIKPIQISENETSLKSESLKEETKTIFITETTTLKPNPVLETKEVIQEDPVSLGEENNITSTNIQKEIITKPLISLENYAVKQLNFILDHILIAAQEFVYKVLQATGNSKFQRDHLKLYAENLDFLLNPEDYYSEEEEQDIPVSEKQPEDPYTSVLRKMDFLKGNSTQELQSHLPQEWVKAYKTNKQEVSIWLDKAAEQTRFEFNRYVSEEEDNLRYQYFNEAFDDIPRANEIHQKLAILADLIKIIKNQKQISFLDLYMH